MAQNLTGGMEATRRNSFSRGMVLLGLGVVLFAVGAKLGLVQLYGTDQPYADQWAAEGMYFLRGPLYYDMELAHLISHHGEHRPALTRLWVRGLILANEGQWDPYVELVANLFIYVAFLGVLWRWLVALVPGRWLGLAAVCMAVLFGLPCAYENFLWGFQSQFLFLLLLGAIHLTGTLSEMRLGGRWWGAQVAGFLGLFSIAAGVMSAAALVVLAVVELLRGWRNTWAWSTLVVNGALLALGLWLLPEGMNPPGGPLERLGHGVLSMGYLLSWPFQGYWPSLLIQLPWIFLLIRSWVGRDRERAAGDRLLAGMGLWVACMAFAIGYGRGVTSDNIGVRYYDVLILGLFVNVPALIRLLSGAAGWKQWLWGVAGVAWLVGLSVDLRDHNRPTHLAAMFDFQKGLAIEQRAVVRDFLVSNDPAKLQEFENNSHRFPHFQITLEFLRDPQVALLLPPSLTSDGRESRLSRWSRGIAPLWMGGLGLGVFLAGWGWIRLGRGKSSKTSQIAGDRG